MEELQRQIDELTRTVEALSRRVPETLVQDVELAKRAMSEAPIAKGPAVSNTPTATGYLPTIVNGKQVNLMIGS